MSTWSYILLVHRLDVEAAENVVDVYGETPNDNRRERTKTTTMFSLRVAYHIGLIDFRRWRMRTELKHSGGRFERPDWWLWYASSRYFWPWCHGKVYGRCAKDQENECGRRQWAWAWSHYTGLVTSSGSTPRRHFVYHGRHTHQWTLFTNILLTYMVRGGDQCLLGDSITEVK